MDAVVKVCVAEYERYSDDPWATVAVVKYIYLYVFYPYTYIYLLITLMML